MKRNHVVCALLALALFICAFAGCSIFNKPSGDPEPISIPTTEPTGVPTALENSVLEAFIGDWYGVYSVTEARGIYAPNAYVSNDCAMRVAVDNFGRGGVFLQVNGMGRDAVSGSSNVFALCNARVAGDTIALEGMVNRFPVEWEFKLQDGQLMLTEVYGDVDNYMRIEIALARPDELVQSSVVPEGLDYLIEHGFVGAVDLLGGSSDDLPQIVVPEGCDPHIRFTSSDPNATELPAPDGTVMSADGHIMVSLPEGYEVVENTVMDFVVACPEQGVIGVDFTVSAWNTDSLSFLLSNTPNVSELYHYTIDGFDFYGTFIEGEPSEEGPIPTGGTRRPTSIFKLCGTDGTGTLIIISFTLDLDSYAAYTYVNIDNAAFTKLILNARLFSF